MIIGESKKGNIIGMLNERLFINMNRLIGPLVDDLPIRIINILVVAEVTTSVDTYRWR